MIMLTIHVRKEEKRFIEMMQRQDHSNTTKSEVQFPEVPPELEGVSTEPRSEVFNLERSEYVSPKPRAEVFNLERSRKMFYQALFYVGAFYCTWWAPTLNRLAQMITEEDYFFFMLATTLFAPLQGFMNFLIYRHGPCIA
eukprot:CAMPEP_0172580088 /NCGR_PEP_ID=MMETSP1067-20121228/139581_1 /TAXON_ID=265564 ORGANISM="Thalassiosira punctigera, Strain Tpunct2005C2" /NCGR_SAMPLE_ID=MMETSP1067 /ASSEMBLY_ACC=CAM_ASM_000444 /LENGTH=139 /DNA_ID=CAMNT_0013372825 /DNA_START=717 /DNA_END=1136 /DNA_ORIENTATION=-